VSALATPNYAPSAPAIQRTSLRSRGAHRLFEPGRATLEQRVLGIWEELRNAGHAECPVCSGELVAGGGCPDCDSELS
jgi:hypothetical protein